jgi:prepilin-type processing-associated H-X9-DG protein
MPSPWIKEFKRHFESPHVTVIDLGSVFSRLPKEVLRKNYLFCDGHLSVHGNALAATHLIEAVRKTRVEFE